MTSISSISSIEEVIIPSNVELGEIAEFAARQVAYETRMAQLLEQVAELSKALRQVQEIDLPAAMDRAGVSSITLVDGSLVTVKPYVFAAIPKDERYHAALDWLRAHQFGDLIKNKVEVSFGKEEDTDAAQLVELLKEHHWTAFTQAISVHPQTLKAWVTEQLKAGNEFPLDLFGAGTVVKSNVKLPSKK